MRGIIVFFLCVIVASCSNGMREVHVNVAGSNTKNFNFAVPSPSELQCNQNLLRAGLNGGGTWLDQAFNLATHLKNNLEPEIYSWGPSKAIFYAPAKPSYFTRIYGGLVIPINMSSAQGGVNCIDSMSNAAPDYELLPVSGNGVLNFEDQNSVLDLYVAPGVEFTSETSPSNAVDEFVELKDDQKIIDSFRPWMIRLPPCVDVSSSSVTTGDGVCDSGQANHMDIIVRFLGRDSAGSVDIKLGQTGLVSNLAGINNKFLKIYIPSNSKFQIGYRLTNGDTPIDSANSQFRWLNLYDVATTCKDEKFHNGNNTDGNVTGLRLDTFVKGMQLTNAGKDSEFMYIDGSGQFTCAAWGMNNVNETDMQ